MIASFSLSPMSWRYFSSITKVYSALNKNVNVLYKGQTGSLTGTVHLSLSSERMLKVLRNSMHSLLTRFHGDDRNYGRSHFLFSVTYPHPCPLHVFYMRYNIY